MLSVMLQISPHVFLYGRPVCCCGGPPPGGPPLGGPPMKGLAGGVAPSFGRSLVENKKSWTKVFLQELISLYL